MKKNEAIFVQGIASRKYYTRTVQIHLFTHFFFRTFRRILYAKKKVSRIVGFK